MPAIPERQAGRPPKAPLTPADGHIPRYILSYHDILADVQQRFRLPSAARSRPSLAWIEHARASRLRRDVRVGGRELTLHRDTI